MTKVQSKNAILFDITNDVGDIRDALVDTIGEGTTVEAGLIAPEDKTKLDGIAAGATANAADVALRDRATHTGEQAMATITGLSDALASKATAEQGAKADAAIPSAQKGAVNGVATLDSSGKVPAIQLPSFVDDVLEYDEVAEFPTTGETAKIYIALDTGRQYRWSGSGYAQILASPGTTDDITEGASKLFFTAGRVRDVLLAGLSSASSAAIAASDSVLSGFGKLQAQITSYRDRANQTGTQAISTVTGLQDSLDGKAPLVPATDASVTLGSATKAFNQFFVHDLYVGGNNDTGVSGIRINGAADSYRDIIFQTAGVARWVLETTGAYAEAGGNSGSDFVLSRRNDDGSSIDNAFKVSRETGILSFTQTPTVGSNQVETKNRRGVANGYASLGADGLVPSSQLPASGSYKGNWNASTNTPTITAGVGTNGDEYTVSVAGTQSVTGSSTAFSVGDRIKFTTSGNKWELIPNSAVVSSVNGKVGVVVLNQDDVADGTTNKAFTAGEKSKLAGLPTEAATAAQGTKADSALQPGSFGIGATDTVAVLANLDDPTIPNGLHTFSETTAGTPPEGAYTGTVLVERYSGSWCKQTLTYRTGELASRTYIRTYDAFTAQWRPWKKVQYNDDPLSLGTFSTDLTSGQQSQVTTRPAVFTNAKAKIVLSSSYSGSDIQPAVHVTTKIDDDSGATAAAKVAGIYSYMEQTGSSTNQYPKAIAGVAVNAAVGNNDATGVVGYAYKLQATGGIGDAAAIGGAAWQYSDQEGLVIGCETSAHQNVPGTSASPNATSGNNTMSLHVTTNSTGARAWSGIAIDTFGLSAGRYGFWNAINIGRSCFGAGAEGMGKTGTVGINFGNNTTTGPEKAIYLGNAEYHFWRAGTVAIRAHASSFDFENKDGGTPGIRLITPSAGFKGGYFGAYKGAIGADGNASVTPMGAFIVGSDNYPYIAAYDTSGTLVSRAGCSPSDNALIPLGTSGTMKLGASSRLWSQVYAATATINTSDERYKTPLEAIPGAALDAWGEVWFGQFRFLDAVAEKRNAARLHTGVVAQRVMQAFSAHGLNAADYGLLCYDEWEAVPETVQTDRVLIKHAVYEQVLVREAVIDEDGSEIKPATYVDGDLIEPEEFEETKIVNPGVPAGNRYGIRYEEALCMEAAYQRRRAERLEARLSAVEEKLQSFDIA